MVIYTTILPQPSVGNKENTMEKKNPNPFINMANEAKKNKLTNQPGKMAIPKKQGPKPTKGFGNSVMRKTGRGG